MIALPWLSFRKINGWFLHGFWMQQQGYKEYKLYGILGRENVQLAVSIELMLEIVICDIGNKQRKELNFCGVVEICF